jgi:hypothetical protein
MAVRDFRAEYARRVARGLELGRSRSQARGHPRAGEGYVSGKEPVAWDRQKEAGVRLMRSRGYSAPRAAGTIGVPDDALRRYLRETGAGEKRRGDWVIKGEDDRERVVPIYSKGKRVDVVVDTYEEARKAGSYMGTVGHVTATNDPEPLAQFEGEGITDIKGKFHPFELRINTLYRLVNEGPEPWELAYRINAKAS